MTERIGKYTILANLASGGMAELSLGCTAGPGGFRKYVVLKRILPDAAQDERFVQMFLDEARITAAFSHPNIAQVFELGEDRDIGLFVAMEFIPGQNLNQVVDACAEQAAVLPLGFSISVVYECALALHYAHTFTLPTGERSPVIHRDVAQKNVMVTFDGQVKLLDFGIAKAKGALSRTRAGTVKGTAGYMSPEQVRGENVDGRSDVFSLGVVLWEMMTGRRLFSADTELEELRLILSGPIERPDDVEPSVTPALADVAMKALQRDKAKRYASARDFSRELQAAGGQFLYDQEARAGFMAERFAEEMESTRKLFSLATASEDEVQEAARAYRESGVLPRHSPRRRKAAAGNRGGRQSVRKLKPVPATPPEPRAASEATPEKPPPSVPRTSEQPSPRGWLWAAALGGLALVGVVVWKLALSGAPAPMVAPDIGAIPGTDGPVAKARALQDGTSTPSAEHPPEVQELPEETRPVEPKQVEPKSPRVRATGEVNLVLLPEAAVYKGKQKLGEGSMMKFSLPVGTHLVRVRGSDGVDRKLSLQVEAGKNRPLKLRVSELPKR